MANVHATYAINMDAIRERAHTSIATYQAMGSALGARERCLLLDVSNTMDVGVYISLDGTTDQFFVPAGQSKLWDLAAGNMHIGPSTTIYAKRAAASSSGNVYVSVFKR